MERGQKVVQLKQRIKKPDLDLKLGRPQRDEATPAPRARDDPGAMKRFVAVIPERIHRQIRQHCLNEDMDMRDYFLELLKGAGIE